MAQLDKAKSDSQIKIDAIRLEAQQAIAAAKLESQQAIADGKEETLRAYQEALAALEAKQPKPDGQELEKADESLYTLNDSAASNNWVVHGNYTTTGKPILCGDPHLGTKIPAFWQL